MAYLKEKLPIETAPGVCTLPHFAAWLRTQPIDKIYCWMDQGECLFGSYGKAYNLDGYDTTVKGFGFFEHGFPMEPHKIGRTKPWTYGAALARTLKAMREL
jgi:hypothetical protein